MIVRKKSLCEPIPSAADAAAALARAALRVLAPVKGQQIY